MERADLHIHTNHSDGAFSPEEIVGKAHKRGLSIIAITDHDTMSGLPDALDACRAVGITLVSGIEISADVGGTETHLLAYACPPAEAGLNRLLSQQRQRRAERAELFLERFRSVGIGISKGALESDAPMESIGRPHLAKILVDAGAVDSIGEAFDRYLVEGTQTFIPKPLPVASEVISTVHSAGGVVVLAHPGHHMSHNIVRYLIRQDIDGIEVVHPSHDKMLVRYYSDLADKHHLLKTGGSDYHGWRANDDENFGAYFVDGAGLCNLLRPWTL